MTGLLAINIGLIGFLDQAKISKDQICLSTHETKAPPFMEKFHLLFTVNVNVDLAQKVKVVCLNFNVRSFIICHCFVTGDMCRPLLFSPTWLKTQEA